MSTKARLTLVELQATTVWTDLTSKQKVLVETFIQNGGDRVKAMLAAYAIKSPETARVLAYDYFKSPRVIACLTTYFQGDPLEDFKAEVRAAYRNKDLSVAQVDALKLHASLNGWGFASLPSFAKNVPADSKPQTTPAVVSPAPATKQKYAVGDIFTQKGVQYRVTKLDANGEIDDAEDVV